MNTQLATGVCMVAVTLALVWAGSARAAPPEQGTYQALTTPIIACDTKAQMQEVVEAVKGGTLQAKLQEMTAIRDDYNEPVCVYSPLSPVAFGESDHIGQIKDHDRTIDAWIAHVGNQHAEFYILWGEEVKTDPV